MSFGITHLKIIFCQRVYFVLLMNLYMQAEKQVEILSGANEPNLYLKCSQGLSIP